MSYPVATQRRGLPLLVTSETCSGGTFIVTGANTGLGYEAAKHLVALGASKVILGVRNLPAGEMAKANIVKDTGLADTAEVWALDLASYDSVKAFAKKANTELDRIDAIIENAGVAIAQSKAEGHSMCMTVNVFSTFLLAALIFPKLKESAQRFGITPHLSIVSSGSAYDMKDKWDEIKDDPFVKLDDGSVGLTIYPLSKLVEMFVVRELASLAPVSRTGVVINYIDPGVCKTDLSRNAPPEFRKHLAEMHEKYGRTAEDGSRTILHGAVGGKDSHGRLLDACEIADDHLPSWITDAENKNSQKLVWDLLAKELESISPGSVENILHE